MTQLDVQMERHSSCGQMHSFWNIQINVWDAITLLDQNILRFSSDNKQQKEEKEHERIT